MRLLRAIALILTSVIFFQCQKEVSYVGGPDTQPALPAPITATLQGNVLDENGQPAAGVNIRVGTKSALTDAKGYFRIKDAALDKNSSVVTAEKPGYFKAYRTFNATSGTNQVVIKLIQRSLAGTINAASGGDVSLSNGMKVALPANGVVNAASNAAYTGTVNVYAAFIDPTASDIAQRIPGSFMADDANGGRVTLSSYGMMAVELESASGEKLQIKQGSKATITNPIPSSLQSSAPSTIALWYVDEATGIWQEEGSATKSGTNYVGEVSHFSFWNCDISIPAITLTTTINNTDGQPLVHAWVRIQRTTSNPSFAYGYTDSLGQVSGLVPANESLILNVLDACGNSLYTQNIGPFSQNTTLPTITISGTGTSSVKTVKGKLINCGGTVITNGFAIIHFDNQVRYDAVDANGNFSTNFITCSTSPATFQVIGVDATAQQQGSLVTGTVSGSVTDIGNVSACGVSSQQYINYTLDGTNYTIDNSTDSLMAFTQSQGTTGGPYVTTITGSQNSSPSLNNFMLRFSHPNAAAGVYAVTLLSVQNYNQTTIVPPFNVTITNYPANIGDFYEGNFSGSFTSGGSHTVSGNFRIRRMY